MAIRKILLGVLGEKRYLAFLAGWFQRLYNAHLLGREYADVYFLQKFIRAGDYCIDIGAHLGYFTLPLSRLVGDTGKVFAVEPMSAFHNTLQRLLQKTPNVTLYQVALGGEGEFVQMGIPDTGATKHFGYARVVDANPHLAFSASEKVRNESGDRLFNGLPRLDFVKCDVEGLEYQVLASMINTIGAHHPILLCELFAREYRIRLFELLQPFGYQAYGLENDRLVRLDVYSEAPVPSQNYYFIPPRQLQRMRPYIRE
jgi:FkbM family methyltransferase